MTGITTNIHTSLITSGREESMGVYYTHSLGYYSLASRGESKNLLCIEGGIREQKVRKINA
jgi:hypothetical protein